MGVHIKVKFEDAPFKFRGPDCTLMLLVCGADIVHPERGEMKIFFPAAKAANEAGFEKDGTMYSKEPSNDTLVELGDGHDTWSKAEARFNAGFEVPDYLLARPEVLEIIECLRRAPGAIVTTEPFPDPVLSKAKPYPTMPYEKRSGSGDQGNKALPF